VQCTFKVSGGSSGVGGVGDRDPIARVVKRADISDNGNEGRLALLPDDVAHRLRVKYARAAEILEEPGTVPSVGSGGAASVPSATPGTAERPPNCGTHLG
jgi:hypothetical protein